ncbi:uncharacterized protein LOC143910322 [Arctopsyche grandis]|uniref:uncharacterized protein LOC143910322 n=1 Tax=Arctopsyche grandis TaxID=121162 RepID=UPI00406D74B0
MAFNHKLVFALVCIGLSVTKADGTSTKSIVCSTTSDDGYAEIQADPTSCQHFYICSHGVPYRQECLGNLHFNPNKKVCDFPEVAGCRTETVVESRMQKEIEQCNDHNGIYVDLKPDPKDCSKYYVCDWGRLIHMSCPPGTIFRAAFKRCDFPQYGGCITDNQTKSKVDIKNQIINTIAKTELEQVVTPHENNISQRCTQNSVTPVSCAQTLPEDRLLPHPDDCELFYYCVTETLAPICRDCPAGLHFNPVKKVCDHPPVAGCKVTPNPALSRNTHKKLTKSVVCATTSDVDLVEIQADPTSCRHFYICSHGVPYRHECPVDLEFNTELSICDYPDQAQCSVEVPNLFP